ncbi:MAG TPA: DUF1592 domain-containing protein, partial [Terriglobia bacterium]|nr:DUF1592 domain-containing protein [Terriglobia bacterium]
GKLPQAIELYLQAAKEAGKDRTLAAKALIRAAASEEKLGQPDAVNVYGEVIRMYPDQREQAQVAQVRLAALMRTPAATMQGAGRPATTDVSAVASPMFEEYCIRCHSQTTRTAALALDSLNAKNVGENTATWERVLARLRARRDPPSGLARPDEKTYQAVISKLESALDQAYPAKNFLDAKDRATDDELATRIAAFIWGSAPDAGLQEDARKAKLHDPATLDQQVRRMLRDPKSVHLVTSFFEPQLSVDKLDKVSPNQPTFPDFDSALLQAMGMETRLFLDSQLREDHGALELWTANYSFLNERLARHYGIPNVSGNDFRRVTLPNNNRAGLLGQGSVLTVTSQSNRTSPVTRGIWVLRNMFGMRPPDPPANIPPIGNTPEDRARTMRERMAAHKTNPACVNCHAIFDPLGLALENFDGVGQWRSTEGGAMIDVSGAFNDGSKFNGPAEFRAGLLKYRDAYYSNITQQLIAYALGRKGQSGRLYDYEMPSVRAIVKAAAPNNYRWTSIVSGIVNSAPFQKKDIVP